MKRIESLKPGLQVWYKGERWQVLENLELASLDRLAEITVPAGTIVCPIGEDYAH